MNSYSLSQLLHWLVYIADSIFLGLKFTVPLIFLLTILKITVHQLKLSALTVAANTLLLTGGMLFLVTLLINTFIAWYSERDFIIILATGPHWFQFVIPVLNFALLPNLMWFKKIRKTTTISFVLVLWWIISNYLVTYLTNRTEATHSSHAAQKGFSMTEYSGKAIIFFVLISIIYFIFSRKKITR